MEVDGEEVSLEIEDEEDEKGWTVLTNSLLLLYLTALVATWTRPLCMYTRVFLKAERRSLITTAHCTI